MLLLSIVREGFAEGERIGFLSHSSFPWERHVLEVALSTSHMFHSDSTLPFSVSISDIPRRGLG